MNKRVLLVEPAYKTKYPPLGLMKIATYHKMKGDEVVFVKGRNSEVQYQYWDRVYISTLFTWTWDETIRTIEYYRTSMFNLAGRCFVGGILASLMPDELFNATGIQPVVGLLDDPKKVDQDDNIIIDRLRPDYSILTQVENGGFKYANTDAYLGYTTRGCVWKCEFCAVRRFEPQYVPYLDIKPVVRQIIEAEGEKPNLVLMDNNVLASPKFDQVIDDIESLGFLKGATLGPTRKKRRVDFNQGLDARFLTEEKMKRLSEIPLDPMRVAFDSIESADKYVEALTLAHRYGQKTMSNYLLYNFKDTPWDFYERLKINIDLTAEFNKGNHGTRSEIYSFPMRFIPLDAKNRAVDTGNRNWNRRYLRSVQLILNVVKGIVMPGQEFFLQAFGRNKEEFKAILLMPDGFILNRLVSNWRDNSSYESRLMPYVSDWMQGFTSLSSSEQDELVKLLSSNDKTELLAHHSEVTNPKLRKMLEFHIEQDDIIGNAKSK
jgi:hypothetical protein